VDANGAPGAVQHMGLLTMHAAGGAQLEALVESSKLLH
jgi:hypothetical protein